jgi:hypothetical protein
MTVGIFRECLVKYFFVHKTPCNYHIQRHLEVMVCCTMENGMHLQRHLISFELKNTYVGIMPFLYPYIFVDMCSYIYFKIESNIVWLHWEKGDSTKWTTYLNTRKTTVCIISYTNVLFLKEPSKKVCCELNFKCEGAYHFPLCNKPSLQDVVGCDNCMEWYHFKCLCLTKEPKSKMWFCGYCDS